VWYTTSTDDVYDCPRSPRDVEVEARLSLVAGRVLLICRALEACGEPVRSKRQLRAAYERATGMSTSGDKISRALAELHLVGVMTGLRVAEKSS